MSGRFTQVLLYKEKHHKKEGEVHKKKHFVRSREADILTKKVTFFKIRKHETIFYKIKTPRHILLLLPPPLSGLTPCPSSLGWYKADTHTNRLMDS